MDMLTPVFISYAEEDQPFVLQLETHLAARRRFSVWHQGSIGAGEDRESVIAAEFSAAKLIVLMISASYLASGRCRAEAERAIAKKSTWEAEVVAIVVRACLWRSELPVVLEVLPPEEEPVASLPNRDETWTKVVRGIETAHARFQMYRETMETVLARLGITDVAEALVGASQDSVPATSSTVHCSFRVSDEASDLSTHREDVDGLINILEQRAAHIRKSLRDYKYAAVHDYLREFDVLHREHVQLLKRGMFVKAHEIAEAIHRLSYRLEKDEFYRRNSSENPNVRYCVSTETFARGSIVVAYFADVVVRGHDREFTMAPPQVDDSIIASARMLPRKA